MPEQIVIENWKRHRQWSALANRLKLGIERTRTVALALSTTGALLQTLTMFVPTVALRRATSVAGTAALVAVPFITQRFLTGEQVRRWLRARSTSEALKSRIYRYLARGEPYHDEARNARFQADCREAEAWVNELAVELAATEADSSPVPTIPTHDDYLTLRVRRQIESYYRPKARQNALQAKRFRTAELLTSGAAALIGAVASALHFAPTNPTTEVGAWVAVLTTIGAAIAAHAASNRYDMQARIFFATARQLEDLVGDWESAEKPEEGAWPKLVSLCEDVISAENRGWMAKLDSEEKSHAP